MGLFEVGWNVAGKRDSDEYLVELTNVEARKLEEILKARYHSGEISDYWIADAIVFSFPQFEKKVLFK
jgi:hypothetical protein